MAPFGHKDDGQDNVAALTAEIERVNALPLPQLAAEVMTKGFGPDGPGAPGKPGTPEAPAMTAERVSLIRITQQFTPAFSGRGIGYELQTRLLGLVAEGVQLLQNAALVRVTWNGGAENYQATRLGRAAVERDAVERVVSGGTL